MVSWHSDLWLRGNTKPVDVLKLGLKNADHEEQQNIEEAKQNSIGDCIHFLSFPYTHTSVTKILKSSSVMCHVKRRKLALIHRW